LEDFLGHQADQSLEDVLAFAISHPQQADQDFLRLPRTSPEQAAPASAATRLASPGNSHFRCVRPPANHTTHPSRQFFEIPTAVSGLAVHGVARR
jgi:hypothetical protein